MTDEWSRPPAPERRGPVFEITLAGDGPLAAANDHPTTGSNPDPPNWRKIVGVASIGGVAVGILVTVLIGVFGGNGDDTTADELGDRTSLPSKVTTPPTLPPLDSLPEPDTEDTFVSGTNSPTASARELRLPTYLPANRADTGTADNIELATITPMSDDVNRRSTTRVESTATEATNSLEISYDAASGRYLMELTDDRASTEPSNELIFDPSTNRTYWFEPDDGRWLQQTIPDGTEFSGFDSLADLLHAVLLGPLRPDSFGDVVEIEPRSLVVMDSGMSIAREFGVEIAAPAIPEWARFVFGPFGGETVATDETLTYQAFVSDGGELRRIQGINAFDGNEQMIVHTIERLPDDFSIDLPDPSDITVLGTPPGPATSSDELRPTYEVLDDSIGGEIDLAAALAALDASPPNRSIVTSRSNGGSFVITTQNDPTSERTATTFKMSVPGDLFINEIEDRPSGRVLRQNREGERWLSESIEVRGSASEAQYLTGLVDPTVLTVAQSTGTRSSRAVMLDDGSIVREFELVVPAAEIDLPADVANRLLGLTTVFVAVDLDGRVRELQVLGTQVDDPHILIQRFEYPAEAPIVTLPDPSLVDER